MKRHIEIFPKNSLFWQVWTITIARPVTERRTLRTQKTPQKTAVWYPAAQNQAKNSGVIWAYKSRWFYSIGTFLFFWKTRSRFQGQNLRLSITKPLTKKMVTQVLLAELSRWQKWRDLILIVEIGQSCWQRSNC